MELVKSLKQLISEKVPAFYITDASSELIKEIQSILGVEITGIVNDRTKESLAKFKSDRNLPYPASLGVQTAQALLDSIKSSFLRLTRTDKKDSFGCVVLLLQYFKNGQAVDEIKMRSGQPSKQYFRKGVDSISGSGEPLPEGRWRIENLFWAGGKDNWNASHGDGIGPVSVPLTYDGPGTTGRSAIVIHNDHNVKTGKPGSVGCPVTYELADMRKVVAWLRDSDPKYLYADWNLGSCPPVDSPKPNPHSNALPACGVELIKKFESCFLNAYPDPLSGNEPITVGWGCTVKEDGSKWKLGDRITAERADKLLIDQLTKDYYPAIANSVPYWEEMNEGQQGALLSFSYNLGRSFMLTGNFNSLRSTLKEKRWADIPATLLKYRNPGSNVELGLYRRRYAEGLLWNGSTVQEAWNKAQAIKKVV
jgi:GH24 family phage-related lysozyme (muramidase)